MIYDSNNRHVNLTAKNLGAPTKSNGHATTPTVYKGSHARQLTPKTRYASNIGSGPPSPKVHTLTIHVTETREATPAPTALGPLGITAP